MDTNTMIIVCYTLVMIIGVLLFTKPKKEKNAILKPELDYETIIGILDSTIQREITHQQNMIYKVRDVRVIYDFEEDLTKLVKEIMSAFSPSFLKSIEFYYDEKYVIKYVTRFVQTYLIEYTRVNKINTK